MEQEIKVGDEIVWSEHKCAADNCRVGVVTEIKDVHFLVEQRISRMVRKSDVQRVVRRATHPKVAAAVSASIVLIALLSGCGLTSGGTTWGTTSYLQEVTRQQQIQSRAQLGMDAPWDSYTPEEKRNLQRQMEIVK